MERDSYEIALLEVQQVLKEAEAKLKNQPCIDMLRFRKLAKFQTEVRRELLNYRSGVKHKNLDIIRLIGG